jgi:ABC-type glycerol-3-phosphate transport system permease component
MIPKDYIEAAKVDGAGNFRIMFQVIMPFALGTMLTVFLLNFITYWNDYQIPMIYLPSHPVAAYGMYVFQMSTETALANTPVKLAGIFLMAAPIVLVALIFSRRLMANLSVGGVKE